LEFFLSLVSALTIGALPIKKIYVSLCFPYKQWFPKNYDLKKCWEMWGEKSLALPALDLIKGPIYIFITNSMNYHGCIIPGVLTLIVIWQINLFNEVFYGRGISLFGGIILITDPVLFKYYLLLYSSLLLITRYQSLAGFITGILIIPLHFLVGSYGFNHTVIILLISLILIINYCQTAYHIFAKNFYHLSSRLE